MGVSRKVLDALKDAGAVLKRARKHHVYELPNGKNVVVSNTPSDFRAENNALREIKAAAGIKAPKVPKAPRQRGKKPGAPERMWSLPPVRTSLATKLSESGVAEKHYRDKAAALDAECSALRVDLARSTAALERLRETRWMKLGEWLGVVRWARGSE